VDRLRREIMREGFDPDPNLFMKVYGGKQTDAALLVAPQVGFLAYDDEHLLGTVCWPEDRSRRSEGTDFRPMDAEACKRRTLVVLRERKEL
jgi:GH15 family glucan-1,4-alpha-glucosidase